MRTFDIFQSYIGDEQASFLSPEAIPVDASNNTSKFSREYELFKKIYSARKNNPRPWGLVSWKFNHKNVVSIQQFLDYAEEKLEAGYQCVAINPMIGNEAIFVNVWEQGLAAHKKMGGIIKFFEDKLSTQVNYKNLQGVDSFCFCNYFIATPHFWRGYFDFTDQICEALDLEAKLGTAVGNVWQGGANYTLDNTATMRPFIIERLLSAYFDKLYKGDFILFKHHMEHYRLKFGRRLGELLYKLSELKNSSQSNFTNGEKWVRMREQFRNDRLFSATVALDDPSPLLLMNDFKNLVITKDN